MIRVHGDIRRINVRATEIQMGDRSTVIVPNSEFITKIVRNVTMAEGTVAMLREQPLPRAALVLMGRAHLPGYARELVETHGFTAID